MTQPVFAPETAPSWWPSIRATQAERTRPLPGDERIPDAIGTITHGVTIDRPPRDVWPWLVQMGAGSRGGWYSYDWLDNRHHRSASRIIPELQHPEVGTIFPALPTIKDGFRLAAIDPGRSLTLEWPAPDGSAQVTWVFVVDPIGPDRTRLLVRVRAGQEYRFHGLPAPLTKVAIGLVHFVMQRKQLLGIVERAERAGTMRA